MIHEIGPLKTSVLRCHSAAGSPAFLFKNSAGTTVAKLDKDGNLFVLKGVFTGDALSILKQPVRG